MKRIEENSSLLFDAPVHDLPRTGGSMFVRLIAALVVLIGAAGFLMPFWIGSVPGIYNVELPLSDISDVAISNEGDLFFANTHQGRIQIYSRSGEFIRGIDVKSAGGLFCIDLHESELKVSVARRDAADILDLSGKIVRTDIPINEEDFRASCEKDAQFDARLDRAIVSLAGAVDPITIKRKTWHYLALSPFASWATFVAGLALFPEWRRAVLTAFKRRKREQPRALPTGVLKVANTIVNLLYTAYIFIFTAAGIFILVASLGSGDPLTMIIGAAFGLIFVGFSSYGIYKVWATFDDEIVLAPGISFQSGPAGIVAWKAFGILLVYGFIFCVFYFGEKWAQESGYYDEEPVTLAPDGD